MMKLTVLVPSSDYQLSAGARIRYARLAEGLADAGISLELIPVTEFDPVAADCDMLLISKCPDARSVIAAAAISRRGKLVGVDLFDDYFSQSTDSRLVRQRAWLSDILEDCDFSLCSTERMAEVVQSYKPQLPVHVLNDPAREHSVDEVLELADRKVAKARRQQVIRVAWFGVGDNPYFKVGLADLSAHSAALSELTASGMAVELTILTNGRALRADGLEVISRLPVACTVRAWSEEVEREVLESSLVAFLPVGGQAFSAAKSLNRAWTALSFGCQILSRGLPIYAALEPLVYRESSELLSHLAKGAMRVSTGTSGQYRERLNAVGSAETEALRLGAFLKGRVPSTTSDKARLCVVHGLSTRAEVHHLTGRVSGLSVASPYCSAKLHFDIVFRGFGGPMTAVDVSHAAARTSITRPAWLVQNRSAGSISLGTAPIAYQLATYAPSMRDVRRQLETTFGSIRMIISETSRLPVSAGAES